MEFWVLLAVILTYSSLSSKLSRITNNLQIQPKKKFPSLQEFVGKSVKIETDDHLELLYGCKSEGILKEYDDTWIVLEAIEKKNKTALFYYRLNNITAIHVQEK